MPLDSAVSRSNSWVPPFLAALLVEADDPSALSQWIEHHSLSEDRARWLIEHELGPYLFFCLRRAKCLDRLPAETQTMLASTHYLSAAQRVLFSTELYGLLADLRQAGIEPIVLKGAAFGVTLYPAPETRPISDVDLLIAPDQLSSVQAVSARRGYRDLGLPSDEEAEIESVLKVWREYPDHQKIMLEIHWRLFHELNAYREIGIEDFRSRARQVIHNAQGFWVMNSVDQLIHACAHLSLHHAQSWNLLWLLDLRLLVQRYAANWNWHEVAERAASLELSGSIRFWLKVAQNWFGQFVPAPAWTELNRFPVSKLEAHYLELAHAQATPVWRSALRPLQGLRSIPAKVAYVWLLLFPPWNYMQFRYHATSRLLAPVYYGWRMLRAIAVAFRKNLP
jgi:hypothetical protein